MKKHLTPLLFLIALTMAIPTWLFSQSTEQITDGREYWFGIPHCLRDRSEPVRWGIYPIELWISSKFDTQAIIESADGSLHQSIALRKGEVKIVPIPDFLENTESEVVRNKGIYVKGDLPVSLAVFVAYKYSGEAFRVTPVEWLGKEYFTLNMYQDQVKMRSGYKEHKPAQILVIATEDRTEISYKPACETEAGIQKGQIARARLDKGDTYLIHAKIRENMNHTWATDLSGTKVWADKPIAVISGHTKAAFPRFSVTMLGLKSDFMRNMLSDMMWPVSLLGKEYVSAPIRYKDRTYNDANMVENLKGDLIRFVATEDETEIFRMRSDGSGLMKISPTMKEGDWYDILEFEFPGYFKANKKILIGQYGKAWWIRAVHPMVENDGGKKKKENSTLNPPRNGQGMMFCLTPIEQWCSHATFRSPEGMDNFFYLTFHSDHTRKIYFDGQSIYARFGVQVQPILGTDYSYVAANISSGTHSVYAEEDATFGGYAYGNWDYYKDGFAYGYPIGINFAIKCEDSLAIEGEIECGDVVGTAYALPEDSTCARIFSVMMVQDSSYNYEFEVDDFDPLEDQVVNFYLNIIDIRKPAYGLVRVQSRSGKVIFKSWSYIPELVEADPDQLDFGLLKVNETKCMDLVIKNPGEVEANVKNVRLKYKRPEFKIDVSGLPIVIPPGESRSVEVCATALELSSRPVTDSVYVELSCYEDPLAELIFTTGEPIVWISDASWGSLPVNTMQPRDVNIENRGTVPVEIYSIDWPDKDHFPKVENLDLPLTIPVGETHTFQAFYTPLDEAGVQHSTRATFTANTEKIKLYSDWNGEGIEAGPVIVGYDWEYRRVLDEFNDSTSYEWSARINNIGNTRLDVIDVYIENDYNGVFKLDKSKLPNQLNPNDTVWLKINFEPVDDDTDINGDPIEEYQSDIIFRAEFNGEEKQAKGILHGIEQQPHVDAMGYDFGEIIVHETKDGEGHVMSIIPQGLDLSKMELTVFDLTIEGANADMFEIQPDFFDQYIPPFVIEVQGDVPVPITYKPTAAGTHTANLVPNDDAPNEDPVGVLTGSAVDPGVAATDHDFGKRFITLTGIGQVTFLNTGTTDATITSPLDLTGPDASAFRIIGYRVQGSDDEMPVPPFVVKSGETLVVDVSFTPMDVRTYNAKIDYINDIEVVSSQLTGEGMIIKTEVEIPKYTMDPGTVRDIDVKLNNVTDETKPIEDAAITEFKLQIFFKELVGDASDDVIDVWPEDLDNDGTVDIGTNGTLTEGWDVLSAVILDGANYRYLQVEMQGTQPLKGSGTLFTFPIRSYLSDLDTVPLPVDLIPSLYPYVVETEIPGEVVITPVCVNDLRLIKLSSTNYSLANVAPNPVNDRATIKYSIGLEAQTTMTLFDTYGNKVATLVDMVQQPGEYEVSVDVKGLGLNSGVYEYRIQSGPYEEAKSLVVTR